MELHLGGSATNGVTPSSVLGNTICLGAWHNLRPQPDIIPGQLFYLLPSLVNKQVDPWPAG